MQRRRVRVTIFLYFGYVLIVGGSTVSLENTNATRHIESSNVISERSFLTRDEERGIEDQLSKSSKFGNTNKFHPRPSSTKIETPASLLRGKKNTREYISKTTNIGVSGTLEVPVVKKALLIPRRGEMRTFQPTDTRRIHGKVKGMTRNKMRRKPSDVAQSLDVPAHVYPEEVNRIVDTVVVNEDDKEGQHYDDDDGVEMDYYLSLMHKRDVQATSDDHEKTSRITKMEDIDGQDGNGVSVESTDISKRETALKFENYTENSTWKVFIGSHNVGNIRTTESPWPLVPGPISCDLDFQLQPSFVARLGEFDYVVSVQLRRNSDEPADHACTGVIYNPRFIVIASHCLHENYGLTVTSTDDLCTVDETIDVDYIIEHENYDAETRSNDIALIKLKSEIHKQSAKFPKEDGAVGETFYAVGFGELMWRSFPDKISKLLQKVPVRRYQYVPKEKPGTLHITMSHMDLTGAFRGDFGGTLINPQGEFVGLKSKLVKKSTEYVVYTRARTYLPWIQSMVALHGSW